MISMKSASIFWAGVEGRGAGAGAGAELTGTGILEGGNALGGAPSPFG